MAMGQGIMSLLNILTILPLILFDEGYILLY